MLNRRKHSIPVSVPFMPLRTPSSNSTFTVGKLYNSLSTQDLVSWEVCTQHDMSPLYFKVSRFHCPSGFCNFAELVRCVLYFSLGTKLRDSCSRVECHLFKLHASELRGTLKLINKETSVK